MKFISLDMDGCLYNPWDCCQVHDPMYLGTEQCRHLRKDTLRRARAMKTRHDAEFVVLSYRHGCHSVTEEWLRLVGIRVAAIYSPYSPDAVALIGEHRVVGSPGQFKVQILDALTADGHRHVTHYDDSAEVLEAVRAAGYKAHRVWYRRELPADQRLSYEDWLKLGSAEMCDVR